MDLPPAFLPRKLRASFVTAVRSAGADLEDLQAYVGQTPKSVMSIHYDHVGMERFQRIADLAEELHEGEGHFGLAEDGVGDSSVDSL